MGNLYVKGRYEKPQKSDFIQVKKQIKSGISHLMKMQREKKKRDKENRKKKNTKLRLVKIKPCLSEFLGFKNELDIFSDTVCTSYFTNYFFVTGLKDKNNRQFVNFDKKLEVLFRKGLLEEQKELEKFLEKAKTQERKEYYKKKLHILDTSLKEVENKRGQFIHLQRWLSPLFVKNERRERIKLTSSDINNFESVYSSLVEIKNEQKKIKKLRDKIKNLVKKKRNLDKEKLKLNEGKNNKYNEEIYLNLEKELDNKFKELEELCESSNTPYNMKKYKDYVL
jgi:hypothetical protein